MRDTEVGRLSSGVLKMKFMSKSRDKEEKRSQAEQAGALFASQLPENLKGKKFFIESSYVPLENLRYGRFSFKNCNPEVEQVMRAKKDALERGPNSQIKEEVDKKEMASFYSSMNRKFEGTPQGAYSDSRSQPGPSRGGYGYNRDDSNRGWRRGGRGGGQGGRGGVDQAWNPRGYPRGGGGRGGYRGFRS